MYRVRPIAKEDFEELCTLADLASLGMTNLPKNRDRLFENLARSLASFAKQIHTPSDEFYLFVLEEMGTHEILGISAILAKTGVREPLEYFQVKEIFSPRLYPEMKEGPQILEHVVHPHGPTEICSLYIKPTARHLGLGKLLSFSRFMFIAAHRNRFTDTVFADMRGVIDKSGRSPFWDAVGKKFLPIEFKELMKRRDEGDQRCYECMPRLPIYVDLLSEEARLSIGQVGEKTLPALEMLLDIGFIKTAEIDLFDAGPRIVAPIASIEPILESETISIKSIKKSHHSPLYYLSNDRLDFRACIGQIDLEKGAIDEETAAALEVQKGNLLRYYS